MNGLLQRLWNLSPASACQGIARRMYRWSARGRWCRVKGGPLRDYELYFDEPIGQGCQKMIDGTFEDFLLEEIARRTAMTNTTCWDIGGHVGYHSMAMAAMGARVVAFEPNRENAARFRKNVDRNPKLAERIELIESALSDRDGELGFVQSDDMGGASSGSHLEIANPPEEKLVYRQFQTTTVRSFRADTLISNGTPGPDLIKLDVEGGEWLMLQGAEKLFEHSRPVLFIEVHHILLMLRIQEWLLKLNYRLTVLDEGNATPGRCFLVASGD